MPAEGRKAGPTRGERAPANSKPVGGGGSRRKVIEKHKF